MPPQQDDIRIGQAEEENSNPIVIVNGKEVIVSSATDRSSSADFCALSARSPQSTSLNTAMRKFSLVLA